MLEISMVTQHIGYIVTMAADYMFRQMEPQATNLVYSTGKVSR
jgi:hypothetical protein